MPPCVRPPPGETAELLRSAVEIEEWAGFLSQFDDDSVARSWPTAPRSSSATPHGGRRFPARYLLTR
jgi:hypothetical protein